MGALKRTTEDYAEQIAEERYGKYLGELTTGQQGEVWERAGERVQQELERRLEMEADRKAEKYCPKCGVLFAIHEGDGSCPVADDERKACPKCGEPLAHFSGLEKIPSYLYCPSCNDTAYAEDGSVIGLLE
jgi:uncharacterized protein YbaR (Trm112 family)